MQKKLTGGELDRFCREFLLSMDPNRAAKSVGREDGYAFLRLTAVEELSLIHISEPTRH